MSPVLGLVWTGRFRDCHSPSEGLKVRQNSSPEQVLSDRGRWFSRSVSPRTGLGPSSVLLEVRQWDRARAVSAPRARSVTVCFPSAVSAPRAQPPRSPGHACDRLHQSQRGACIMGNVVHRTVGQNQKTLLTRKLLMLWLHRYRDKNDIKYKI